MKTKKNVGDAYVRGLEGSVHWNVFADLYLRSNVTTTYGQNVTNHEPVGGVPPTFALIGLAWGPPEKHLAFFVRLASKQDRLSSDDKDDPRIPEGGTPGWRTYNIRAAVKLTDTCWLRLAIENILDYNYREHGSGINGPGRNLILSLEVSG